jgi:SpoVK/Ycf46/Vps4 family AAA+-type ATPase
MAGRHLKELIAAYHDRDDLAFRRATQAIIEEEEAKRHTVLARDLRQLLASGGRSVAVDASPAPEPPRDRDTNVPLVDVSPPSSISLVDLVFPRSVSERLDRLVEEVAHWPALDAAGVPRRNRILLYGPPGCGKTTVAAAISGELGLPLLTMRIDSVISSYLGETAANLRHLFDYAASVPSVVLLDEFDSLGKLRDDPTDHGELRRVVNATLQLIDTYRGPSLLIAATNSPEILDAAIWRRFDEVIELPLPTREEIERLLRRLLRQGHGPALGRAVDSLVDLPHAAVEYAVNSAKRRAVIAGRPRLSAEDLEAAVGETVSRPWT